MSEIKTGRIATQVDHFIRFKDEFDKQIESEIMNSERLRARFLAFVFSALSICMTLLGAIDTDDLQRMFHGQLNSPLLAFISAIYAAYELFFYFAIGAFQRRGLKFPFPPKYANAVVEVTFPTLIILLTKPALSPEALLSMPPVFIYFLFIGLSAIRLEPRLSFFTGLVAALEYVVVSSFVIGGITTTSDNLSLFPAANLSKGMLIAVAGGITAFVASQFRTRLVSTFRSREERNLIASIFGQHVSPAVMERLIHQKTDSASETRHVCILFLDIWNFTAFSQSRSPEEVVGYLNRLFDFMIEIVNRNNGIINKFLGDGFMAVFGAPIPDGESSQNAVKTALQISDRLRIEEQAGNLEQTRIGIGLHAGAAVTGEVGSTLRKEYTIIGDTVNLASRIEQLNKQYGSEILMSNEVATGLVGMETELENEKLEQIGEVLVKGRDQPVNIIRLR